MLQPALLQAHPRYQLSAALLGFASSLAGTALSRAEGGLTRLVLGQGHGESIVIKVCRGWSGAIPTSQVAVGDGRSCWLLALVPSEAQRVTHAYWPLPFHPVCLLLPFILSGPALQMWRGLPIV